MNLDNFNSSLNKSEHAKNNNTTFLSSFTEELQNVFNNLIKNLSSINLNKLDDSIYVVRDINDNKLSIVNIANGEESDIYIAYSQEVRQQLQKDNIKSNIYDMSKEDFYSLNLGSNLEIKNSICKPYHDKVKIENAQAIAKLEDMFFCLEQEKDAIFSVCDISDDKIYLTNTNEGGYFSIPKEGYPDFKVGDLIKNNNGKYTLI